jgi:hypothetical protein
MKICRAGVGGHEQLISNSGRFKPVFAEMIDLRGISTNWLKSSNVTSQGFLGYGLGPKLGFTFDNRFFRHQPCYSLHVVPGQTSKYVGQWGHRGQGGTPILKLV